MKSSSIPKSLRAQLLGAAFAVSAVGGVGTVAMSNTPSPAVILAMELGDYYEGARLTPYQDSAGVWTVCRGITFNVVLNKQYTHAECRQLELGHYRYLESKAKTLYTHWNTYNLYVRASMLDMLFNLGVPKVRNSTHLMLANSGDLQGACAQMTRWVWAQDAASGKKVRLNGLVDRRNSTAELCAQWGRDGHFSSSINVATQSARANDA